jgi:hypothetical protein
MIIEIYLYTIQPLSEISRASKVSRISLNPITMNISLLSNPSQFNLSNNQADCWLHNYSKLITPASAFISPGYQTKQ